MRGYTLDEKRRPTFRYSFQNVAIEDTPIAVAGEVDPFFRRTVTVNAEQPPDNLWFRAWSGSKVEEQGGGVFLADGKVKLRFELPGGARPVLRQSGGGTELLVPIPFVGNEARIVEEITW